MDELFGAKFVLHAKSELLSHLTVNAITNIWTQQQYTHLVPKYLLAAPGSYITIQANPPVSYL